MFWGLKLDNKERNTSIVERSFTITHATAELCIGQSCGRMEVHAQINNNDIILCHLDPANDLLQERLDIRISEGEAVVLYLKTQHSGAAASVHLSGYLLEEPTDSQWEAEFTDYEEEDANEEEEEEEEMVLVPTSYLLGDTVVSDDSDEEYRYVVVETATSGKEDEEDICSKPPAIEELSDDEDCGNKEKVWVEATLHKREVKVEKKGKEEEDVNEEMEEDEAVEEEREEEVDEEKEEDEDVDEREEEVEDHEEKEEEEEDDEAEEDHEEKEEDEADKEEDKPTTSTTRKRSRRLLEDEEVIPRTKKLKKSPTLKKDLHVAKLTQGSDSSMSSSSSEEPFIVKKPSTKNGVTIKDIKVGTGKLAKPGKKVYVQFEGRLAHNDEVFDASKKNELLQFRLGRGDVIKGWDIGITGMRVGGKRQLLVPASKGYGAKGLPHFVPPHSNMLFTIKLADVK